MRALPLAAALLLGGCASAPAEVTTAPAPPPAAAPVETAKPPAPLQYLYGSPEAAVAVGATNARIADYGAWRIKARPKDSVVLAAGATMDAPTFEPCGNKPFAAVAIGWLKLRAVLRKIKLPLSSAFHPLMIARSAKMPRSRI